MIDYKREEKREQEEYEEYLAIRRLQERRAEEQALWENWFQQMQHEQDLAKEAESYYAEQAQSYYLTLHIVHILRQHLNAMLKAQTGGREVRIKYKRSICGMSPTCKARPTVKVGSMSCEECEYFRGQAFGSIGKETTVGGRKIDLYGGWVECAAPEMQDEQEEEK